ncbi:MAG: STAS domain-containing protein [Ignavibacteriales bacterium]|nr:STAS domain-containing protein [Ignavibacteriales bacterium]
MLQISITQLGNYKTLEPTGRIDGITAYDIEMEFEKQISKGERTLLIDFTGVNYISSAGLRIFVGTQKNLKKIGGELILFSLTPSVLDVFRISGLNQVFRLAKSKNELPEIIDLSEKEESGKLQLNDIPIEYLKYTSLPGKLFNIGNQSKLSSSDYSSKDVISINANEIEYGAGLAALGESYEDYKNLFGESLVIKRNFFSFPARKNSFVDFMLFGQSDSKIMYNFLYGFGFNGSYSAVIKFGRENNPATLNEVVSIARDFSTANLFGIVLLAESAGFLGMHLRKIPISENKIAGENIFDQKNFTEWVDFPIEASNVNNIISAIGVVVKDKSKLIENTAAIFTGDSNFHFHGNVFEKGSINKNIKEFDSELNRVLTELQILKVQHTLGKSMFKNGIFAIIELEEG